MAQKTRADAKWRRFKTTLGIQVARVVIITPIAIVLIAHWGIAGALVASIAFPLSSIAAFVRVILRDFRKAKRDLKGALPTVPSGVGETILGGSELGKGGLGL